MPINRPSETVSVDHDLAAIATADLAGALALAKGEKDGLQAAEVGARLKRFGPNVIAREGRPSIFAELWGRAMNPLNALLLALAVISYFLSDARSAGVIAFMVLLSSVLGFIQEHRSNNAAAKLAAMIRTRASVKRRSGQGHPTTPGADDFFEIPLDQLVPGDLVRLSAGDVIPGDLRLLSAHEWFETLPPLFQLKYAMNAAHHKAEPQFHRHRNRCWGHLIAQRLGGVNFWSHRIALLWLAHPNKCCVSAISRIRPSSAHRGLVFPVHLLLLSGCTYARADRHRLFVGRWKPPGVS